MMWNLVTKPCTSPLLSSRSRLSSQHTFLHLTCNRVHQIISWLYLRIALAHTWLCDDNRCLSVVSGVWFNRRSVIVRNTSELVVPVMEVFTICFRAVQYALIRTDR